MTPEGKVKKEVKAYLTLRGWWFFMPVQNGMGLAGVPDILAVKEGQFLAVETKAPGKRNNTTANQDRVLADIAQHGSWSIVTDDVNHLRYFLEIEHGQING